MSYLVDYSFARPAPDAIKAAGAHGVIRYLSSDAAKAISVAEARELHATGLSYALVYEDGPMDFSGGANAGAVKARIAALLLVALTDAGLWGHHCPIYAAVDGNLPQSDYVDTWEGIHAFASSLGRPDACYGPRPFLYWLEQEHEVSFLWECGSANFNTGPEPSRKTLQQLVVVPVGCRPLAGVDWDEALVNNWGQFPSPAPCPPSSPEESMLFLAKSFDGPATLLYDVQSQTCRGVSLAEARMYEQVGIKNYGATLDNAVLSTFGRVG